MIAPINLTEEYRRLRQDVIRRKQKFSLTQESTQATHESDDPLQAQIPWLDDYLCARIAITNITEACEQQAKNLESLMRSKGTTTNMSLDRQVMQTANVASQRIQEARARLAKVTPNDDPMPASEMRMRFNAAKILAIRLKEAVESYNNIHHQVISVQTQNYGGEVEMTVTSGGKSPPRAERLKTQLMTHHEQQAEQLFSSNQINQMHEMMQVVVQLFDDANYLIIEQGSMLDRVDQNIDLAIQKTLQSKQQIKKAVHSQKHGFAKQTIVLLLILNSIMLMLNGIKIYWRFG